MVDSTWEWEYRLGFKYSDKDSDGDPVPPGEVKLVTWLVVAKDHYEDLEPHVTLLSEELIGRNAFDNSKSEYSTQDKVFIPSTTELGDTEHEETYPIGSVYPYFQEADNASGWHSLATWHCMATITGFLGHVLPLRITAITCALPFPPVLLSDTLPTTVPPTAA